MNTLHKRGERERERERDEDDNNLASINDAGAYKRALAACWVECRYRSDSVPPRKMAVLFCELASRWPSVVSAFEAIRVLYKVPESRIRCHRVARSDLALQQVPQVPSPALLALRQQQV